MTQAALKSLTGIKAYTFRLRYTFAKQKSFFRTYSDY